MAVCLNTNSAYILYKELENSEYFVDKSMLIELISRRICTNTKFICITKPRRFGKTSVLNMLGAYYCKAHDSHELFDGLKISKSDSYEKHLNKYNVINLSLNSLPEDGSSYMHYMSLLKETLKDDIMEKYPKLNGRNFRKLSDMFAATGEQFIFIIDEWDYIFSHGLYPGDYGDFLEFFRDLLKDKPYVALVYMTGVLPIKKYSTGSALNMFHEYTMLKDRFFEEYFGFSENEVETLCRKQSKVSIGEMRDWYNGYTASGGLRVYNPCSVIQALMNGYCQSYWARTGKFDEVLFFLKYNIGEVRDDVVKMVNGASIMVHIEDAYYAGQESIKNRKEIYSAMIIYGLLSYCDGEVQIPNKELMIEFERALEDDDFGYVAELVKNSENVLYATLDKNGDAVASYLHNIHNAEIPILKYNDENSLACVVTLAYLAARNKYKVEREAKSGKGFVDFIFYPRKKSLPGIILELKADGTPEAAIRQVKEKEYAARLRQENVGRVIVVGLNYDTAKKEHQCVITEL